MKKLFAFLVLVPLFTVAQTNFYQTYGQPGSSDPACVMQLPDSGYVIFSTDNGVNQDQELRRLDKYGNVIWYKKMITAGTTEEAGVIMLNSKNHILIAGRYNSNNLNLFRLDLNGNIIFKKVYTGSGAHPKKIVEDPKGNIYVVTDFADVIKTDSTGTLKWNKRYPNTNYIESILPVSANKIILVGSANWVVDAFSEDIVHLFIDSTGALINQKGFGTSADETTEDAFMDASKRIYTSIYQINRATKDTAVGFMCTDTMGNQLWTRTVKGNFIRRFSGALLKDNSLLYYATESLGSNDIFHIFHFSNDGKALQHLVIPGSNSFYTGVYSFMGTTSDGGYFLLGWDNLTSNFGLLKVGPSLIPTCKTTLSKGFWERNIKLNELQYVYPISTWGTTSGNSTYSLTPLTPTFVLSCTNTCNTTSSFLTPAGNICLGSSITFTNNGQNFSSCVWKVNGSPIATTTNFNFTFSIPGTHTITSVVTGACIDSMQQMIVVDSMPNPNFSWSKQLAKVKFQAAKYKSGTSLVWNFGDGTPLNTCYDTVVHNYRSNGTYTICLTETNTCGSKQVCKTLTISPNYSNSFYWLYKHPAVTATGQSGVSLLQMADGGYFLAGSDDSYSGTGNGLLNRLDSAGNLKRSKIAGVGNGYIDCLDQTQEGGAIVLGTSFSPPRHLFGKIDSTGAAFHALTFTVTVNDRIGNGLIFPDGRMVFCGGASPTGYITMLRKNLTVQFFKTFNAFKAITAIRRVPSGCYYAYGNNSANLDPVLMKLDSSFNVLWIKQYDFSTTQYLATDMQISPGGKIYMTGSYNSITPSAFILATDSLGNPIYAATYKRPNPSYDNGRTMLLDKKGNIFVNSYNNYSNGAGAIIKTDSMGNTLSVQTFSMSTFRLQQTYDGGISTAASYKGGPTSSANYSVTAIKLDTSSTTSCWGSTTLTKTALTPTVTNLSTLVFTTTPVFGVAFSTAAYNAYDTLLCSGSLVVTSLHSNERNSSLKIFPNPATSEVTVVSTDEETVSIELVNSFGQVLFVNRIKETETTIDMRSYEAGIYFIKVKHKDGTIGSKKLIKLE